MALAFDHIIHYVHDPGTVSDSLQTVGLTNHAGGKHEKIGTFNTLTHFGLSYIEYLGIDHFQTYNKAKKTMAKNSPILSISDPTEQERFIGVCLRTYNLDEFANHLRKKGVITEGPSSLSRRTTTGELLSWELLHVGSEQSELSLPFFIDWKRTDEDRTLYLERNKLLQPHSAGDLTLSYVQFAVTDFSRSIDLWQDWFELEDVGEPFIDPEINAEIRTLNLSGGNLRFAKPLGEGIVQSIVESRGPSPFEIGLSGSKTPQRKHIHGGYYVFF